MLFEELNLDKPIPTNKLNQLYAKNIMCVNDVLREYPRYYIDYTKQSNLLEAVSGERYAFTLTDMDARMRSITFLI